MIPEKPGVSIHKLLTVLPALYATVLFMAAGPAAPRAQTGLRGPYFGQTPPGLTPQVFAPGFISSPAHEFSCSFTPDGKEFYFTRQNPNQKRNLIMVSKLIGEVWTEPAAASFTQNYMSFEPMVTPDGHRLYFTSDKPIPGQQGIPMNIWYVERQGEGWSDPRDAGSPLNPMKTMYVSRTLGGTIYTTDISRGPGGEGIAVVKMSGGKHPELERLGPPVNVGAQDMYPYIAPDESYLIFASRRPAQNLNGGLFITYRQPDGSWKDPQPIDLGMQAGLPFVSPDGKYLFFTAGERGKSDIYWVDAKILKEKQEFVP